MRDGARSGSRVRDTFRIGSAADPLNASRSSDDPTQAAAATTSWSAGRSSRSKKRKKPSWSGPICVTWTWVKPASTNWRIDATWSRRPGRTG